MTRQAQDVTRIIQTWLDRSDLGVTQIITRAGIPYEVFHTGYRKPDHSVSTDPDMAVAVVHAFTEGLADDERCTAAEALRFLDMTKLPLTRYGDVRDQFPDEEWQQAWGKHLKHKVDTLIEQWFNRSGLSVKQVIARAGMTYDGFYNSYRKDDRPINTDPEKAIAIVRAFSERLFEQERCTAAEAICFMSLVQLPLHRYAEVRNLFPAAEWQQAWDAFIHHQVPTEPTAPPASPPARTPEVGPTVREVLAIAEEEAKYAKYDAVYPEHMFIGLCKLETYATAVSPHQATLAADAVGVMRQEIVTLHALFQRFGLNPKQARRELRDQLGIGPNQTNLWDATHLELAPLGHQMLARAGELAGQNGTSTVTVMHLLAAQLDPLTSEIAAWLSSSGIPVAALREAALHATVPPPAPTARSTTPSTLSAPHAAHYDRDLTRLAREGKLPKVTGRRDEMLQIVRTLSRVTRSNPLLIGEPGVGRTTIVEGLAWRIAQGNVRDIVSDKRIVQISLTSLVARARGEIEKHMRECLAAITTLPATILFLDEIDPLIGGGATATSIANCLKPALAPGELRCISKATPAEYQQLIKRDPGLELLFQPIMVPELTSETTLDILRDLQPRLEQQHDVTIAEDALWVAVTMAVAHRPGRLPRKAIELLDEGCACARITRLTDIPGASSTTVRVVTAAHVSQIVNR